MTIATSIANLRTVVGTTNAISILLGGASINDFIGGMFYWNASSTASDDGNNIIQVTSVTTGRWIRLTPEMIANVIFLNPLGSTPGSPSNGELWYEVTNNRLRLQEASQIADILTSVGNFLLSGVGNRVLQVNANGDIAAPNTCVDQIVTDSAVITAITGATYNVGNNYTAAIVPAGGKFFYQGQIYISGPTMYIAASDNVSFQITGH